MIISHIAAVAKNKVIGNKGDLPWDLPEDMKFFRQKTSGHIIIMGRKTYESFPKPLKNRLHVVITRQENYQASDGVEVFKNIEEALEFCKSKTPEWGEEVFIIGGGEIYKQTLNRADQLYITELDKEFEGDAQYPDFEKDFIIAEKDERFEPFPFAFCLYTRKSL
mgnify:CR=1 FL=1